MLLDETQALHVRFEGRSEELDLAELALAPDADDAALLAALARRYGRAPAEMRGYVVAREGRAIIVRPVAYYG